MGRVLLAVDASYHSYRASAAHPGLSSGDVFTGGLYGFFVSVSKMIREVQATHVVFCTDSKPYTRSLEYAQYKQLRKATADPELLARHRESLPLILDTLKFLGLPVWGIAGFESDDLIAHCVTKYRHRYDHIWAGSNDGDLFQLFGVPNFAQYVTELSLAKRGPLITYGNTQVTPAEFMLCTALTGTHNDIEGIHKVGPVTAIKIVRDAALMRQTRERYGSMIDRNLRLIQLPHPEFPRHETIPALLAPVEDHRLYRALGRYDIQVTTTMVRAMEQLRCTRAT